jgi:hypothetical protein
MAGHRNRTVRASARQHLPSPRHVWVAKQRPRRSDRRGFGRQRSAREGRGHDRGRDVGGVALDRDAQDGLAPLDQVAVVQVDGADFLAVDEGAVGAAQVHQPATRWVDLGHEVVAREVLVLEWQAEVGVLGAADNEGLVAIEGERLALVGPLDHREPDLHDDLVGPILPVMLVSFRAIIMPVASLRLKEPGPRESGPAAHHPPPRRRNPRPSARSGQRPAPVLR